LQKGRNNANVQARSAVIRREEADSAADPEGTRILA
jgi:hypothetical protein